MAEGMAGATRRLLLVPLVVTSGAALAWVKVRRRRSAGSMPRSWSELDPSAPASLGLAGVRAPVVAPAPSAVPVESAASTASADLVTDVPTGPADDVPTGPADDVSVEPVSSVPVEPAPGVTAPVPGPFPGSVLPLEDGSAPSEEFVVKGNAGSMRSHSPSSPYYGRTRAEVWFRSQDDAAAAGFQPWAPKR